MGNRAPQESTFFNNITLAESNCLRSRNRSNIRLLIRRYSDPEPSGLLSAFSAARSFNYSRALQTGVPSAYSHVSESLSPAGQLESGFSGATPSCQRSLLHTLRWPASPTSTHIVVEPGLFRREMALLSKLRAKAAKTHPTSNLPTVHPTAKIGSSAV